MGYFNRRFTILLFWAFFAALGTAGPSQARAASPVVYVALWSDVATVLELSDFADRQLRGRLQSLVGVAEVTLLGERRPALLVRFDPQRIAAYGLRQQDVEEALSRQSPKASSIRRENDLVEFVYSSLDQVPPQEKISQITVAHPQGHPLRLLDVAVVELGAEKEKTIVTYQGKRVVALGLVKKWWANTPAVLLGLRETMPTLRPLLPPGMSIEATFGSYLKIENAD